jgi:hypothetical protein|tara:strand:- start:357 stop:755 length:399 start_codon:yes stop_codon:yes gene_type:complete
MDKRGSFVWPRSILWLFMGLVFLYLALMPFFEVFPYNFEVGSNLLRLLIFVVGILILFESFRRGTRGLKRISWISVGLILAAFGIYIFLMGLGVNLPFVFNVNQVWLQIILALYSVYLIIGAWGQTKVVEAA